MKYIIREMHPNENFLLEDFLYQAIYQPDKTNLAPRSIIKQPELQVYIKSNLRFLFLTNIKKWVLAQR